MDIITVNASRTYDVHVGQGLLAKAGGLAAPLVTGRHCVIISDDNVFPLYGDTVQQSMEDAGFRVETFIFQAGEASKNTNTLLNFLSFMAENEITREDPVVALGGGVTGDMGALAAALFLRGVPCIQIPTSLLAMVDSSVGGKTAIDLPAGKNLVGTFTQPYLVLCDTDTLKTLPDSVFAEGMAEIIKYGMLGSRALLELLDSEAADDRLQEIVTECIAMKRDIVAADEHDLGERQILNFGHTIGHAIERCSNYGIYHGEGVAMGMGIMTRACVKLRLCPPECEEILERLLGKYHLPDDTQISHHDLLQAARADKKRRGDAITLIQPVEVGKCVLHRTHFSALEEILQLGSAAV